MSEHPHTSPIPRVLVAGVMHAKSRAIEALAKVIADVAHTANVLLVRSVVVKSERRHIQQLVLNVANDNEADAIIMVGGTGIGQHDETCEAINAFVERPIEGFGEAYRRLLDGDLGGQAMLARASAGVYNQCLVYAMTGREADVRRAMEVLVLPTLAQAVELATGRAHVGEAR
ncbi:MAG TPA: molybdopterin-binding protein [Polyangiaceae bacterium]|nr:molybdopterin-binding protein [Polyangiaceae bacterium]